MKYTTLTLPILMLGCSTQLPPVQPEATPFSEERTLQDKANSVYVELSGNKTKTLLSYGDFSQGFWYDIVNSFEPNLQFDLLRRDELERGNTRSLRFTDKLPLGTLDEVLICEDMYEDTYLTNKKHCSPLLHTEGEVLNSTYQLLIMITYMNEQNERDPALEKQLMELYGKIRENEGY